MERLRLEAIEVVKLWWFYVAGVAFGVLAILQGIRGSHASAWFWAFCAVAALAAALAWRLRRATQERDAALATGEDEDLATWLGRRSDELRKLERRLDVVPAPIGTPGPMMPLVFSSASGEMWSQAAYRSWRRRAFARALKAAGAAASQRSQANKAPVVWAAMGSSPPLDRFRLASPSRATPIESGVEGA
jgi:hypothetical protein